MIAMHEERAELLSVQRHMVAEPVLSFCCLWVTDSKRRCYQRAPEESPNQHFSGLLRIASTKKQKLLSMKKKERTT
jgi:hypothetical protein